MIRNLRINLTLSFVGLTLLLYAICGLMAIVVFDSFLNHSLEDQSRQLLSETMPSVVVVEGVPTLKEWAKRLSDEDARLVATIQIFSPQAVLLERYGPPGVKRLCLGNAAQYCAKRSHQIEVISRYAPIVSAGATVGFLQIQMSTDVKHASVQQLAVTLIVLAPLVAFGLGFSGYAVASQAVKPMENTMSLLRRFVADAGHELNTPITVIEAAIQTLEATLHEHEIHTDVLEIMERASQRMKELAANLVLLARLENPSLVAPKSPILLKDVVEPVAEEFAELARRKDIDIVCGAIPALVIIGNLDSLRRMLSNLIQNALRYTDTGGKVVVSVERTENAVSICVEDTGIGMPEGALEHIFDRFYRVDKSRSREAGGSGLGLSIVKAIVEAHKGSIQVQSALGKGSRFIVLLPVRV